MPLLEQATEIIAPDSMGERPSIASPLQVNAAANGHRWTSPPCGPAISLVCPANQAG